MLHDRLVDDVCARAQGVPGDVITVVTDVVDRLAPLSPADERSVVIDQAVARPSSTPSRSTAPR